MESKSDALTKDHALEMLMLLNQRDLAAHREALKEATDALTSIFAQRNSRYESTVGVMAAKASAALARIQSLLKTTQPEQPK